MPAHSFETHKATPAKLVVGAAIGRCDLQSLDDVVSPVIKQEYKTDNEETRQFLWQISNDLVTQINPDERASCTHIELEARSYADAYYLLLTDKLKNNISCRVGGYSMDQQKLLLAKDISLAYTYNLKRIVDVLTTEFHDPNHASDARFFVLRSVIGERIQKDENYLEKVDANSIKAVVDMFQKHDEVFKLTANQKQDFREYFIEPLSKSLKANDPEYDQKNYQLTSAMMMVPIMIAPM